MRYDNILSPSRASRYTGGFGAELTAVDYFVDLYSRMRKGLYAHPYLIDATNVHELHEMTFVFVAIDDAPAKEPIINAVVEFGIPFVDVGMGVEQVDEWLHQPACTTDAPAGDSVRSVTVEGRISR